MKVHSFQVGQATSNKSHQTHGFEPKLSVEIDVIELLEAFNTGVIKNHLDERFRNAQFILQ
ncbi:MAG: hypothetical protein ACK2U3_10445 [Anaerolineales bacterium]|jgi:hypothetical protein